MLILAIEQSSDSVIHIHTFFSMIVYLRILNIVPVLPSNLSLKYFDFALISPIREVGMELGVQNLI